MPHGCNASTCPNGKCNSTGECQDVPRVASPKMVCTPDSTYCPLSLSKCADCPYATPAPRRTLIAFTGLAGSGKSTAALHLVEHHSFTRIRFAGPLKDMMRALGLNEREIEGDLKETTCELLGGKTPRYAMQTIGTEWGRDLIASDLWIRAFNAALAKVPVGAPVVVDDCRFPNEADAITAAGGLLIRIERPGAGAGAAGHSSEAHQLPVTDTISNTFDVTYLLDSVESFVRDLSWLDNATA